MTSTIVTVFQVLVQCVTQPLARCASVSALAPVIGSRHYVVG